jgi:hypothetical protein
VVLVGLVVACVVASVRGNDRFGQYTWYFYDNGDPGHNGLMNVVAVIAFWTVSVVTALLGSVLRRRDWLLVSLFFVVIGVDYLYRAHNHIAGGDALARVVYWSVFIFVLQHVWRAVPFGRTQVLLVAGLASFAMSDFIDFFAHEQYGRGAALEESAGLFGAWLVALAIFGVAELLLTRERPRPDPDSGPG